MNEELLSKSLPAVVSCCASILQAIPVALMSAAVHLISSQMLALLTKSDTFVISHYSLVQMTNDKQQAEQSAMGRVFMLESVKTLYTFFTVYA